MNIGTLARQAGVPIDTVRYYEKLRLIPPASRTPSGYRVYDATDVRRLRFIRRAKDLGFSLEDIAGLLELSARDGAMAEVKALAGGKIRVIDQKIEQLQRVRAALAERVAQCPGHGDLADCPILAALNPGEDDDQEAVHG